MPRNLESPVVHRARTSHLSGICRKLFGPVDHDQLSCDLKLQLREIAEQDTRRWNFNFEMDTPLPGRYHWEEISTTTSSAYMFLESTLVKDEVDSSTEDNIHSQSACCRNEETLLCVVETNQENCSSISNKLKTPCEVTPLRRKRACQKQTEKITSNTVITDFFVKRRRTSELKAVVNSVLTTSSEQAQCKRI